MRTIYKNHPGGPAGYLVQNRKAINLTQWKEQPTTGANRLIFLPECPVFPCKFKAVARADGIKFCKSVCSRLFHCIQIKNLNFLGQPATSVVVCEIRAYSLKEPILTVSP